MAIDLWCGHFLTRAAFDEYLEESYLESENGEPDPPISQLAADQGQSFYDHDFLGAEFLGFDTEDVELILLNCAYSKSYAEDVRNVFKSWTGRHPMNMLIAFIDYDNCGFHAPRSVSGDGYWLHYFGKFSCDSQAGSVDAP